MKYPSFGLKIGFAAFFYSVTLLLPAQSPIGTIKGTMLTSDGIPAESVDFYLKGTSFGTATNIKGEYMVSIPPGDYTAVASTVGFASVIKNVTVMAAETIVLDFILTETSQQLQEVVITGVKSISGMGHLSETNDNILYSGKKTEVLLLDSLNANTAQNNPRQVLGRVPGANFSETEGGGFPSNGIGFRGLNPSQSIETNTRQNGYNITADLYGYSESYYLPPLEAVERIEVTRGASSLQFGPQFGGVINYILKKGNKSKPLEVAIQQTAGSFGLFNSFTSVGGQTGKFNYYSFVQFQGIQGWRPNSQTQKVTGFGRIEYQASHSLKIGIEYSLLRNRIQMPGGFTDSLFYLDSRKSYRARNWLQSPWNIMTATLEWKVSPSATVSLKSVTNISARDLVWRNEDGGPGAVDGIDPTTLTYVNREVQRESFKSNTSELRLLKQYGLLRTNNILATGIRFFTGKMKRQGGGLGTTGSDFDLTLLDPNYGYDLNFTTTNIAAFAENTFRFSNKLSVTPGLRYEYLHSTVKGYNPADDGSGIINSDFSKDRYIFLSGIGVQYKTSRSTNIYANWSQAYRPLDYSTLTPFGTIAKVDKNLKDPSGYNLDLGFRGSIHEYLTFDLGAFYMQYNNRVGLIEIIDSQGNKVPFRTNVANSLHQGIESYVEFNPVKAIKGNSLWSLSFFNSLAIISAKYVSGDYNGKYVEYAPTSINRFGTILAVHKFTTTFLISSTAQSFGDASNTTTPSADAVAGVIPAYTVMDWSSTFKVKNYNFKAGINNLEDKRYFTLRTPEYPGPGIIPAIGRSFYLGIGARF